MEPATWIAFGMFVVAAIATISSLIKTKRAYNKETRDEHAELVKARTEMNLGSIEAAERIIALYATLLRESDVKIKALERKIEELYERNHELEEAIFMLRGKTDDFRHSGEELE